MDKRKIFAYLSLVIVGISIGLVFYPGPKYGIDFLGGTEILIQFGGKIDSGKLRSALRKMGYAQPDVVRFKDQKNAFILRIHSTSALTPGQKKYLFKTLRHKFKKQGISKIELSSGGDKLTLQFKKDIEEQEIKRVIEKAKFEVKEVKRLGKRREQIFEVYLPTIGEQVIQGLKKIFGEKRVNREPEKVVWIGPKVGRQLRDQGIKAILYALGFIMLYIAIRFDLRFAPGAVIALAHDIIITAGTFVLLRKDFTLPIVAAFLTIVGYSLNDTIVVFDRIRENFIKMKERSLDRVVNSSINETLSRTLLTSITTFMVVLSIYIWGSGLIKDFAFALLIGVIVGTYSSIFVASPIVIWLDSHFFAKRR
jgi:preprotein translocase subunit SecF